MVAYCAVCLSAAKSSRSETLLMRTTFTKLFNEVPLSRSYLERHAKAARVNKQFAHLGSKSGL